MSIKESKFVLPVEIEARAQVAQLLKGLPLNHYFHSPSHTFNYVYPEAIRLGKIEGLAKADLLLIGVAALFHDTGYLDQYNENESFGAKRARVFVTSAANPILVEGLDIVCNAILNTDTKSPPRNLLERILRDADLSAFGKPEFVDLNLKLKQEVLEHSDSGMFVFATDDRLWANSQLVFLNTHKWFTQAARGLYQSQKELNIYKFKNLYAPFLKGT